MTIKVTHTQPVHYGLLKFDLAFAKQLNRNFSNMETDGIVSVGLWKNTIAFYVDKRMSNPSANKEPDLTAEFSADMANTVEKYFNTFAVNDEISIEVTDKGLWLQNPFGGVQFLGSTKVITTRPDQRSQSIKDIN